jgi:hypothetical protein
MEFKRKINDHFINGTEGINVKLLKHRTKVENVASQTLNLEFCLLKSVNE